MLLNAVIFRVGVLEHRLGRKKSKFRLLIAGSNPLGCAAFSVCFEKLVLWQPVFWKDGSFSMQAVSMWLSCMTLFGKVWIKTAWLRAERKENAFVIVLMFTDHLHHGGGQRWWFASRTRFGSISFAQFFILSMVKNGDVTMTLIVIYLLCPTASRYYVNGTVGGQWWALKLLNPMFQ